MKKKKFAKDLDFDLTVEEQMALLNDPINQSEKAAEDNGDDEDENEDPPMQTSDEFFDKILGDMESKFGNTNAEESEEEGNVTEWNKSDPEEDKEDIPNPTSPANESYYENEESDGIDDSDDEEIVDIYLGFSKEQQFLTISSFDMDGCTIRMNKLPEFNHEINSNEQLVSKLRKEYGTKLLLLVTPTAIIPRDVFDQNIKAIVSRVDSKRFKFISSTIEDTEYILCYDNGGTYEAVEDAFDYALLKNKLFPLLAAIDDIYNNKVLSFDPHDISEVKDVLNNEHKRDKFMHDVFDDVETEYIGNDMSCNIEVQDTNFKLADAVIRIRRNFDKARGSVEESSETKGDA